MGTGGTSSALPPPQRLLNYLWLLITSPANAGRKKINEDKSSFLLKFLLIIEI